MKYLGYSILLASLLLIGCGGSDSSSDDENNQTAQNEKLQETSVSECGSGLSTDSKGDTSLGFVDIVKASANYNLGYVTAELELADLSGPFTYNKSNITDGVKEYNYNITITKGDEKFYINATYIKDDGRAQDIQTDKLDFLAGSYAYGTINADADINVSNNTLKFSSNYYNGIFSWIDENATVTASVEYINNNGDTISDTLECK